MGELTANADGIARANKLFALIWNLVADGNFYLNNHEYFQNHAEVTLVGSQKQPFVLTKRTSQSRYLEHTVS